MQVVVSGPGAPVKYQDPRLLDKAEFFNRFTENELITFYTLAKNNVVLEIMLDKFKLASKINLLDKEVENAIKVLVENGVLTEERESELLMRNQVTEVPEPLV